MEPICQSHLPDAPWMQEKTRRLPGLPPVAPGDWLRVDGACAAQMRLRDRLVVECHDEVVQLDAGAKYIRSERQCLARLALTGAVVVPTHTYLVARESLTTAQREAPARHPIGQDVAQ